MCNARHRHSIFCVLPPHVLDQIARNGSEHQRGWALDTLGIDHSLRSLRAVSQPLQRPQTLSTTPPGQSTRTIYDAQGGTALPGVPVRAEGQAATSDTAVNEAYDYLGATYDFYWNIFHRHSIDDAGLALNGTIHYGKSYDNAFWNSTQMVFGDGDTQLFNRFTISVDVVGHELTHGVTEHEAGLAYFSQAGALNESMSDVFGSLIKQHYLKQTVDKADWLIGQGLLASTVKGQALRSMSNPGTAYDDPVLGKDPQPADMKHFVNTTQDNGGVHINSGIPNRAFYLVASHLGGYAWEKAGHIWYETLQDKKLSKTATFSAFAKRTVANAATLFGANSTEQNAVKDAWKQVGVKI